jgi:uncharacterized protein YqgC (DUF456 family)
LEDLLNITLFGVIQFIMLVGLFGLIVPIFPGVVIMWLAALGYGVINGFSTVGIVVFVVMTVLMLANTVVDNVMMGVGARQGGASWGSIAVALIAGVVGTIAFPPFGGIIAAPLAVLALEFYRVRDWKKAWLALRGLATGWGLSFVVRFIIGLVIMGLWWLWVWQG